MIEKGIILKGVGSFYEVLTEAQESVTCKARGVFRKQHITPTVGDHVTIEKQPRGYALIDSILPRKNILVRPPVANIDQIFIVIAASAPEPDWLLLDRMIVEATKMKITPVPVLNKIDDASPAVISQFETEYRHFDKLCVSAHSKEGLKTLKEKLQGKVSCFSGQSAVGKSSLLNALFPDLQLAVGELSEKIDRGKHTTRHAELVPYENGAVLDTPGFSLLESDWIEQYELDACYPEFAYAPFRCRYPDCMHDSEPDCGVKALLQDGTLSQGRYERYIVLARENQERRKHRYD